MPEKAHDAAVMDTQVGQAQVIYGDILLLNKCDLVPAERLEAVEAELRAVKADARILRAIKGDVPLPLLLSVGLFESDKVAPSDHATATLTETATITTMGTTTLHDHSHSHDHGTGTTATLMTTATIAGTTTTTTMGTATTTGMTTATTMTTAIRSFRPRRGWVPSLSFKSDGPFGLAQIPEFSGQSATRQRCFAAKASSGSTKASDAMCSTLLESASHHR